MERNKIYHGNNLDILKTFPDNSIDSIVTDPPYGLGKEPDALEVLQSWITTGYHEIKGKGFMGKEWDSFVPQPVFWKECLRVLKPGGHLLSFAGTRTYDWVVMGLRLSGFEIRDMIAYVYGSGFPKSMNIEKAIEIQLLNGKSNSKTLRKTEQDGEGESYQLKGRNNGIMGEERIYDRKEFEASTEQAKQWQGWGTALKPSQETICVAQKPIENSSVLVYNDIKEVFICLLKLYVKIAEENLKLNQQEQNVVSNIVQWIVESNINIQVDLQEVMVMLQSLSMENMNLNTVILWLNTLADLYKLKNTSIIEMVLSMTIELKILKSLEWENILPNIIHHRNNKTSGTQQNVLLAEKNFNDLKMKLDYIQTHFVQESATSLGRNKNLSPNLEPIVMARKPLDGTVANNVLKHGVGGINIDGCRVGDEERENIQAGFIRRGRTDEEVFMGVDKNKPEGTMTVNGRFPANVIHDGSEEVVSLFPNSDGAGGSMPNSKITGYGKNMGDGTYEYYGGERKNFDSGSGSASRFFYTAKASQTERNFGLSGFEDNVTTDGRTKPIDNAFNRGETKRKNIHPTVKPIDLMQYLVRLVTPKGGICLDPFMGSGTTAVACKAEKFDYIGCELDGDYIKIAEARIKAEVVTYDIFDFIDGE